MSPRPLLASLALAAVLTACGGEKGTPRDICGAAPAQCEGYCTVTTNSFDEGDCCDSITCACNPDTEAWSVHFCDAPVYDAMPACGDPPEECAGYCTTSVENFGYDDCCDSITCNCPPSTGAWEVHFCDPPLVDAAVDATPRDAGPDATP